MKLLELKKSCIFCRPREHMQQEQVLLRTEKFYLFAGIGPIVEGYIIIAPYKCDWKKGGLRTISEATTDLLDELIFLRGIVTRFYREVYSFEGGLCFEHGRAGTCGVSDTPHCYHAHLCCFPVSAPIWKDIKIPKRRVLRTANLGELSSIVRKNPHLLIQNCIINKAASPDMAARETWETRVVELSEELDIPRQYLRKLLATRIGNPDLWDWAAAPRLPEVKSLCTEFRNWLQKKSGLPLEWHGENAPYMEFLNGVRAVNSRAYDSIAPAYQRKWSKLDPSMVVVINEFIDFVIQSRRQLSGGKKRIRTWLLDAGCGPATHLGLFRQAGFHCLGIDRSQKMLARAARKLRKDKPLSVAPRIQLRRQDAFELGLLDDKSFDAIWYCAVMVHLPRRFAQATIDHLYRILRPGGILYISAQVGGDAVLRRDGRFFIYYTEAELEAKFQSTGFELVKRWHDTTHKGACGDKRTKYWINYFLTRPRKRLQISWKHP